MHAVNKGLPSGVDASMEQVDAIPSLCAIITHRSMPPPSHTPALSWSLQNVNVIERYNTQHGLFKLLVTNAAALARDARAFVSQHAAAAAAGTVASAGGGPAAAPPAHAAPPPPGEGAWSHSDLLLSYLYALQRLYDNSTSYMDRELADLLWAELVQGAVSKADMNRAVAYFKSAIFASEPWLEPPVVAALLRRVPELPPQFVTKDVYTLTWQMFAMVRGRGGCLQAQLVCTCECLLCLLLWQWCRRPDLGSTAPSLIPSSASLLLTC